MVRPEAARYSGEKTVEPAANVMGRGWGEEERDRDSQRDLARSKVYLQGYVPNNKWFQEDPPEISITCFCVCSAIRTIFCVQKITELSLFSVPRLWRHKHSFVTLSCASLQQAGMENGK